MAHLIVLATNSLTPLMSTTNLGILTAYQSCHQTPFCPPISPPFPRLLQVSLWLFRGNRRPGVVKCPPSWNRAWVLRVPPHPAHHLPFEQAVWGCTYVLKPYSITIATLLHKYQNLISASQDFEDVSRNRPNDFGVLEAPIPGLLRFQHDTCITA